MENETEHESRLSKGLIGVLAIALLGGAGGTLAYSSFGLGKTETPEPVDTPIIAEPEPGDSIELADTTSAPIELPAPPADQTVDGPDRLPAETDTVIEEPPAPKPPAPKPRAPAVPLNHLKKAAFLVRFNKGLEIEDSLQAFRKDKDASRKAFEEWAAHHPELSGMRLEKVNYSGEVILAYDGSEDSNPVSSAKEIAARLRGFEAVRYADPDYTAFPGKGD